MNKELWIEQHDLSAYESQLKEDGGLISVAGYLRVASAVQGEGYSHSLEVQAHAIRQHCEEQFPEGCRIIWITDNGASGMLPYHRPGLEPGQCRTGLTVLVQMIERGYVRHVCVYRLSRLARSVRLWIDLNEEYLQKYGVQVLSATEPLGNSGDLADTLIASAILESAFRHRDGLIVEPAILGLKARLADGYALGKPPYGWRWQDRRGVKKGQRIGIEPDPEQASVVRQIWQWFTAGVSRADIARRLTGMGVSSPSGKSKWTSRTVRDVLRNPIHAGLVRVNGKCVRRTLR